MADSLSISGDFFADWLPVLGVVGGLMLLSFSGFMLVRWFRPS